MAGIEELLVSIVSKFDDAGFKQLDRSTAKANKSVGVLSKSMRGLFVGVIGTIGVKEIVNASIKLENLKKSFETITGSKGAAEAQIKFIREESDRLGLSLEKTVGSYRKMLAAGKRQGLSDSDIKSIYSGAMEYATANALRPEETEQLLTAMNNLLVKGQVSARGLTGQLGKVMPEALQIAQKAMGKTDAEFKQLIKDGLKSSVLLTAMGAQLHTEFGARAEENANTVQGALNRIKNAWNALLGSILNDEGMTELTKLLNEVAKILNSNATKQSIKLVSQALTLVLKNIRLIGGIAAIMGIKRLVAQVALLRLELLTTAYATGTFGAALQGLLAARTFEQLTAGVKLFTKASWAAIAPWLRVLAILLLVKEAIDTIRGKRTVTREFIEANPLMPKQAKDFFDKNEKEHPYLSGAGRWLTNAASMSAALAPFALLNRGIEKNKDLNGGTFKMPNFGIQPKPSIYNNNTTNNNAFTFDIKATDPQGVASEVKRQMLSVFDVFGQSRGFPQGARP